MYHKHRVQNLIFKLYIQVVPLHHHQSVRLEFSLHVQYYNRIFHYFPSILIKYHTISMERQGERVRHSFIILSNNMVINSLQSYIPI